MLNIEDKFTRQIELSYVEATERDANKRPFLLSWVYCYMVSMDTIIFVVFMILVIMIAVGLSWLGYRQELQNEGENQRQEHQTEEDNSENE